MANLDLVMDAIRVSVDAALTAENLSGYVAYKGWPNPEELAKDLAALKVNVSIAPDAHGERRLPTLARSFQLTSEPVVYLMATVSGPMLAGGGVGTPASATITLAGIVNAGLATMVNLNHVPVAYSPVLAETLEETAAGIATAINANVSLNTSFVATALGAVITIAAIVNGVQNNAVPLTFKIGGTGYLSKETGRTSAVFTVHVWAYDDESRALYANAINDALSDIDALPFSDDTYGRLVYVRTLQTDMEEKEGIYRRILFYQVEYARIRRITGTQVLEGVTQLEAT